MRDTEKHLEKLESQAITSRSYDDHPLKDQIVKLTDADVSKQNRLLTHLPLKFQIKYFSYKMI